jgi:phage shock protein E
MMPTDYDERKQKFGLASSLDVLAALSKPDTVMLDVRGDDEIKETGKITGAGQWKTTPCTPYACPQLEEDPSQFVGSSKDTPIVIYCRSGRRAAKAQEVLQSSGYTNVMNAGGYDDIQAMRKQDS